MSGEDFLPIRLVYLKISTYQGISLGADHYYGTLRTKGEPDVEVEGTLTRAQALALNKKDDRRGTGLYWKPGDTTSRLDTLEQVRELGTAQARARWGDDILLVEGEPVYAGPYHVLWCPDPVLRDRLEGLWLDMEQVDREYPPWLLGQRKPDYQDEADAERDKLHRAWDKEMAALRQLGEEHSKTGTDESLWDWLITQRKEAEAEQARQRKRAERAEKKQRKERHDRNREIWEQGERITITVEARRPWRENPDGTGEGFLVFTCFDTRVFDGDKEIGAIGGGTGYVVLSRKDEPHPFMIRHDDLWNAFQAALAAKTAPGPEETP